MLNLYNDSLIGENSEKNHSFTHCLLLVNIMNPPQPSIGDIWFSDYCDQKWRKSREHQVFLKVMGFPWLHLRIWKTHTHTHTQTLTHTHIYTLTHTQTLTHTCTYTHSHIYSPKYIHREPHTLIPAHIPPWWAELLLPKMSGSESWDLWRLPCREHVTLRRDAVPHLGTGHGEGHAVSPQEASLSPHLSSPWMWPSLETASLQMWFT